MPRALKRALPYIGAALGGAGLGVAGGAYYGAKRGKIKGRQLGRRETARMAVKHFRRVSGARNRALRTFATRNLQLMRQNQALRARIGEIAARQKRAG